MILNALLISQSSYSFLPYVHSLHCSLPKHRRLFPLHLLFAAVAFTFPVHRQTSSPCFASIVPTEAVSDAIKTLTLQGVDLSGIITTTLPGETNPVIQSLNGVKQLQSSDWTDEAVVDEARGLLDNLSDLAREEGSGNAAIASRNGGVELMCSICLKLSGGGRDSALVSALNALDAFLHSIDCLSRSYCLKIIVDDY